MSEKNATASATSLLSLGPLHAAQLIRKVDSALVELHSRRLTEFGIDESGLFSHYAGLLRQGAIIRLDEIQAFRLVREAVPAYGCYVVLRAGLGELAFLLNSAGLHVAACEPNAARMKALKAGLDHLLAKNVVSRERFTMVSGFVPDKIDARPLLGVATDFVFDLPLEQSQAFCRGLRRFDGLLINPRLFIRLREQPSEQRAVTEFLRSLEFAEVAKFPREQMIYFARASGERDLAPRDRAVHSEVAPPSSTVAADFDALLERLMALVPPPPSPSAGTTWIERRVRRFDLRSALGEEE